jgi:hypothetical protein
MLLVLPTSNQNQTHQNNNNNNANTKDMYKLIKHLWHMLYRSSFSRTKIKLTQIQKMKKLKLYKSLSKI